MANASDIRIESEEGTVFYRRRIGDWLRRYIIELVVITLVLIFVVVSTAITISARKAFREAKDVRMALKFVGTQYYGNNSCIYDPSKPTGLIDGAAEDVAVVSTHNGQVYLYAWDEKENIPLKFEYIKGPYKVTYTADIYTGKTSEDGKVYQLMGHWDVTYSIRVLNYDSE